MEFISAVDNNFNKQVGENGNFEHGKENMNITQFFFQLVRNANHDTLEKDFVNFLEQIYAREKKYEWEFKTLFKLIAQTRDIVSGKGEYNLSFMMIYVFHSYYPNEAKKMVELFVHPYKEGVHPYGSWKDIKYLCEYIRNRCNGYHSHPLIDYCLELMIQQLNQDINAVNLYEDNYIFNIKNYTLENLKNDLSLVGKWCPREKSKFKWIHKELAYRMFREFLDSASTKGSNLKARIKCKIHLNKLIVKLNKYLDTTQVKQCSNRYSDINYNNVTSLTMKKQKLAFLNKRSNGSTRSINPDRILGATNFKKHIDDSFTDETKKIHGKRCNVYELVKDALQANDYTEEKIVNQQWKDNSKNNNSLRYVIPMSDTSGSMECDGCLPLYNSIGLGIRVSEKCHPAFQNRILTFDSKPEWIVLNSSQTFVEKVRIVKNASWGGNTNFYMALDKILDSCIQSSIAPEEVSDMVLAVFSDMQIDAADTTNFNTMYENIVKKYTEAGLNSKYKKPYPVPHILFWNLRNTTGFPTLTTNPNTTMLSGYNATLLNVFSEKGVDGLRNITPEMMLDELLSHERYYFLPSYLKHFFKNTHLKLD